jgi:hypothetical protein
MGKAGICSCAEEWHWGGHRALAGFEPAGFVASETTLSYLAADGGEGRQRYLELVGGLAQPKEGLAPFN